MRVKLLKQICKALPAGSLGTATLLKSHNGKLPQHGMVRVQWDNGMNIPMYRHEIEPALSGGIDEN